MQIISDFDLTPFNTFGLSSHARYGARVRSVSELEELTSFALSQDLPLRVIGGGSNILLRERVDAVVAQMAMKGTEIADATEGQTLVKVQAGEDWPAFVEWTVAQGHAGLENLAGIPGTVGATPVQNIGAYGLELKDRFVSLKAFDLKDGTVRHFAPGDCAFGYRQSVFKTTDRYVILDVTLGLPRPWRPVLEYQGLDAIPKDADAHDIMQHVLAIRRRKLPDWHVRGNAGSFFHNPIVSTEIAEEIAGAPRYPQADGRVKLSAAWLIEACGLKGFRDGRVGVDEGHALVLVNLGDATFQDVARLASTITTTVKSRFGVELVQEPIIL